jgi:hypothetical protein
VGASAERLANTLERVCDLIETRSAQHAIARRTLWKWVFDAVLGEALRPDGMSLDAEFSHGAFGLPFTLRQLIKHELRGWEQHNHDPSRWSWIDTIRFSPAGFDRWLKEAMRAHRFPTRPKRRAGAKPTLREQIKEFVDDRYPEGVPPKVTNKEIAVEAKERIGKIVHERTVGRALGRK